MKYYKLKYRLSITHSADNNEEHKHNHVLEGEIFAEPAADNFVEFSDMEDMVNKTLEIYQNQYLNSLEEFAGDANIENVGEVFWRKLVKVFDKNGWKLIRLEIGENPLRVYAVSVKEIRL